MPAADLRAWIDLLKREGELVEIEAEVDPYLEVTEITDRVVKSGGPALLFRNVKGSERPLLINQFGTERRMCLAFGEPTLDGVARKLEDVLEMQPPQGLVEKVKGLGKLKRLADSMPKSVSRGACQELVLDPDLDALPIQDCWPGDPAPFITLPAVITRDPRTGVRNVGAHVGRAIMSDERTSVNAAEIWVSMDPAANYDGTYATIRAFVPVIETNGGGQIVNVLSLLALASTPPMTGYSASKAAAHSLTQALRRWTIDFHVAQNDATVKGSGTHDKTGHHCLPNDPNGKLNIAHHAGYWLHGDDGRLTKAFDHICWDGCMFPNAVMMKLEDLNGHGTLL